MRYPYQIRRGQCLIENHICKIPLQNGDFAICDEDRVKEVNIYTWHNGGRGYISAYINGKTVMLHKLLYPEISKIDHINRNKLDNRSCNLRPCDRSQNKANSAKQSDNTSGFKGVTLKKETGKFQASIRANGVRYHIGSFPTAIEAAKAYDAKAKELFGEFANLNFK